VDREDAGPQDRDDWPVPVGGMTRRRSTASCPGGATPPER
jgi:hypothetical protein